ncbi:hypothetical protein M9Y10_007062 [Tritrichomonas musculus]|uniref:HNH nuclease domain-containing protein n=1 Tax=Tritrichomonas musculus TaxID=1915356 RepID=A0ABR2J290_9EUKA
MSYVDLIDHPDYEILNEYPFTIRRKDNHHEIQEYYQHGYVYVSMKRKKYIKHRLIAKQFMPNPDHLPEVDHINNNRSDNRLTNLRWVSHQQNMLNKSGRGQIKYEYVNDLPIDVKPIIMYNHYEFERYYIDADGNVWFDNDERYRKLTVDKYNKVSMHDIYHKQHNVSILALRREYM